MDDKYGNYPNGFSTVANRMNRQIAGLLRLLSIQLSSMVVDASLRSEEDVFAYSTEINYVIAETFREIGIVIAESSREGMKLGVNEQVLRIGKTRLQDLDEEAWFKYLKKAEDVVNFSVAEFLDLEHKVDGKTIRHRLKTVQKDSQEIIELIIRNGVREGKSTWDIAKDIEKYIITDKRKLLVTPSTIIKHSKGLPITKPLVDYKGRIPKGGVDYNAYRIARTELAQAYRRAIVDATKGQDWMIGWRWRLSATHQIKDVCNDWANHNEGYGRGVYRKHSDILDLGHPHCYCVVEEVTVFSKAMAPYFDQAYRDSPQIMKYRESLRTNQALQ